MKTNISNIASVYSGIYSKPNLQGEVYYIQARHFNAEKEFDISVKPDLQLDGKIKNHLLKPGDILVATKGNRNFAVLYKGDIKPAVASSMFIIIRIEDQRTILPEFVTWYLNLYQTQEYLQSCSWGSSIASITKGVIEQVEITIPTLEKQRLIVKFYSLRTIARSINKRIDALKEQEIQHLLFKKLN